jgi:hypothetical protein
VKILCNIGWTIFCVSLYWQQVHWPSTLQGAKSQIMWSPLSENSRTLMITIHAIMGRCVYFIHLSPVTCGCAVNFGRIQPPNMSIDDTFLGYWQVDRADASFFSLSNQRALTVPSPERHLNVVPRGSASLEDGKWGWQRSVSSRLRQVQVPTRLENTIGTGHQPIDSRVFSLSTYLYFISILSCWFTAAQHIICSIISKIELVFRDSS